MIDCITENIVGYSKSDNACLTDNRPVNYNQSLSGLFLDDVEGIKFDLIKKGCESIWDSLIENYELACQSVLDDLFTTMRRHQKKIDLKGHFGAVDKKGNNACDTSANRKYAGFVFCPLKYNGVSWKPKNLYFAVDLAGTYNITIHSLRELEIGNDTPLHSFTAITTGGFVDASVDLSSVNLPLFQNGYFERYVVSIELNDALPLNYTAYCGTCSSSAPKWSKQKVFELKGFTTDDLTDLSYDTCYRELLTGGMRIDWEIECDPANFICDQDANFWKNQNFGYWLAKTIKRKWSILMMQCCLEDQTLINKVKIASKEALSNKLQQYLYEYEGYTKTEDGKETVVMGYVEHLSRMLPAEIGDCWTCVNKINHSIHII